jgi:hypothetical protein
MARVVRLEQPSSVFEELIAISYAEISGPSAPAMPLSEWIGDDQFTNCRIPGISGRLAMQPHAQRHHDCPFAAAFRVRGGAQGGFAPILALRLTSSHDRA